MESKYSLDMAGATSLRLLLEYFLLNKALIQTSAPLQPTHPPLHPFQAFFSYLGCRGLMPHEGCRGDVEVLFMSVSADFQYFCLVLIF